MRPILVIVHHYPFTPGNAQLCPERLQGFAATHNLTIGQYGHSCYELLHRQISYNDSEQMCRRTGGHLVHINNAHEQTFVTSFLHCHTSSHVGKVWIGLNDFTKEGHYTWTDGNILRLLAFIECCYILCFIFYKSKILTMSQCLLEKAPFCSYNCCLYSTTSSTELIIFSPF